MSFSRESLHPYQCRMIEWIKDKPKSALFAEMGLGKTVSTLTAVNDLLEIFEVGCVLIIAPKRVATHTWPAEIKNWHHTKHLKYSVLSGSPKQRQAAVSSVRSKPIHIISRDLVCWLVNYWRKDWPYDMVVIDESSSFKSPSAKRFKSLKKVSPYIDRVVELTGTPASNGLLDLWSQVYLIDAGERLGRTYSGFRDRYFTSDYMGYNFELRPGSEEEIHTKLSDICLTLSASDYLSMPERVSNLVPLDLPTKCRDQYRELEREFLLELDACEVEALSAATLTGKLLQYCQGAMYSGAPGEFEEVHQLKLDALSEVVESAAGQSLLVAYNFKSDKARIQAKFPQAVGIDEPNAIERWNAGEVPMLLAHPASAGHGLNLQHGGNIIVWFGLNWSLELYQQFNARLYRQGQTKPVFIHHLMITDSVDTTVLEALERKDTTQRALLDALKEDIRQKHKEAA